MTSRSVGAMNVLMKRGLTTKAVVYSLSNNHIKMVWPDLTRAFHFQWLRDHCQCTKCKHPSNRQKLHTSGDVNFVIPKAAIRNGNLELDWPENSLYVSQEAHKTVYNLEYLKTFNVDDSRNHNVKLWDMLALLKSPGLHFDFNALSEIVRFKALLRQLYDYGLVFISNVPTDNNSIEKVALKFGNLRETFYGRTWDVKSVHDAKNIAYTSLKLGLHMDLLYFESPPGLQFLHSLENSVKGGESIFLDSFNAIRILKTQFPQYYHDLSQIPIVYHYHNDGHDLIFQRPLIQKSQYLKDQIFFSPPFQGVMNFTLEEASKFYPAYRQFIKIIGIMSNITLDDANLIYKIYLKPGTCAIFANRRVLHGRQEFQPNSGNRHFKGTYVDWDDFLDRVRTLKV